MTAFNKKAVKKIQDLNRRAKHKITAGRLNVGSLPAEKTGLQLGAVYAAPFFGSGIPDGMK